MPPRRPRLRARARDSPPRACTWCAERASSTRPGRRWHGRPRLPTCCAPRSPAASRSCSCARSTSATSELVSVADAARALCERLGALLIVNDRPSVALEAGADGVHVGQDDMPVAEVREMVGPDMLIGLSTHAPAGDRRRGRGAGGLHRRRPGARDTHQARAPGRGARADPLRRRALPGTRSSRSAASMPEPRRGDRGGCAAGGRAAGDRRGRGPAARGAGAARAARRAPVEP